MLRRVFGKRLISKGPYHDQANRCLDAVMESFEDLAERQPQVDCDLGQGVLTIKVPPAGTYVINKQPPNKQIWLSSPISGPKRYDLIDGKWVYTRDNSTLGELLRKETVETLKEELELDLD